jgi:REP element-mobilizing transposase RayT
MKTYYRRRLPHYQPPHATYFITFRLDGSLPVEVIKRLKQEREAYERTLLEKYGPKEVKERLGQSRKLYFGKFDALLDRATKGNRWLADPRVADLVAEALHHRDGREYDLLAYCIMSNHVHMLITDKRRSASLYKVLQKLKSFTAVAANKLLRRSGAFWLHESYDHVVRDGAEAERIQRYILNNPVKAGLVADWQAWKWSYRKNE